MVHENKKVLLQEKDVLLRKKRKNSVRKRKPPLGKFKRMFYLEKTIQLISKKNI